LQGSGGKIAILTQGIIGLEFRNTGTPRTDLSNDITASSGIGLDGTVQINTIGVEPNAGLVALPATLPDPSQQIAKGCQVSETSRFVSTGRGGVPASPIRGALPHGRMWTDVRALGLSVSAAPPLLPGAAPSVTRSPAALVEATGWYRNPATGKVELVAPQASPPVQMATCVEMMSP
jgi:large exoprotein involved in heme utilization and adhesion